VNRALFAHPRADLYAGRAEWEAARTPPGEFRIGASIVNTILTDPWAAVETLTGQAPEPDRATRIAWARGHLYEEAIIGHYALLTERPALPIGPAMGGPPGSLAIVRHRTETWLAVSPDGATVDPELGEGLVEAKDYVGGDWHDADCVIRSVDEYHPSMMPAAIMTQALVQLECSDVAYVDVARRMPNGGLRIIRVLADPDTQAEIVEAVGEFRERHILRGEPLPVDGSGACRRLLTRRFPGIGKECRPATADEQRLVALYAEAKAAEKAHAAAADDLRNVIAEALGNTYGLSLGGKARALLIPVAGRRTIDADALRAAHPDIAERFTRVGEPHRQLRLYGC